MFTETENTRVVMRPDARPTTLRMIGDVGCVLRASCIWNPFPLVGSEKGNISAIRLPDEDLHFGLGAAAFGQSPELAIQRLGESALIAGIPWWTPAEKPGVSYQEGKASEMLTPFFIAWDRLDTAWASLDFSSGISLIEWYEHILNHPGIRKSGAMAIEVLAQVPAKEIVDKYMCRAPLTQNNTLPRDRLITDPDLIDLYFVRNAICHAVPMDTVCTLVMVGVVVDPVVVASTWGDEVLRRGFYVTPGISSHANVIQHTHATVILDSWPVDVHASLSSIEEEFALIDHGLALGRHTFSVVHIENDTRLSQAMARIGIIEKIEIRP